MNEEIKATNITEETKLTNNQVHKIYNDLSEVDKNSTEKLAEAEKATEETNYTENNEINVAQEIPGVNAIPESAINKNEDYQHKPKDIKEVLNDYGISDEESIAMINLIEEYKNGDTSNLYNRLPVTFKNMANNILYTEGKGIPVKNIDAMRNSIAKMLLDEFINSAEFTSAVNEYNAEMADVITGMNKEYNDLISEAIDNVFNKIDEIRNENPEQADRIESIKDAFDSSKTFDDQFNFASHTSSNKLNKWLNRFNDSVFYFNKRVNGNSFGIKVPNIEEIVPIIKAALPQYTEEDIKKFVICIVKTMKNPEDLAGIAYTYKMISNIYKYKFTTIDNEGEIIFGNISKVIDAILS